MPDETTRDPLSIRGLQDAFGTPLKEFIGRLDSLVVEPERPVHFNFTEVDVIKSDEAYPFSTAVIDIPSSTRKQSKWGVFGTSLAEFLLPAEDLNSCVSRVLHMKMTEGHLLPNPTDEVDGAGIKIGTKWANVPKPAWEVIGLDGASAGNAAMTPADLAASILNGKRIQDFNGEALKNDTIRLDQALFSSIISGEFIKGLIATGKFAVDGEGIHHQMPIDIPF